MRKTWLLVAGAALGLLAGAADLPPKGKLTVGVVSAAKRVTRTETLEGTTREIALFAARREWEPFQVIVRAEGGPVRNLNATVTDLVSPQGGRLAGTSVRLFREHFINVLQVQPGCEAWKPAIEYPDPLLPFADPYDPEHKPYAAPWDNGRIGGGGKAYLDWAGWSHGAGFCFPEGQYTGADDRQWVVQIEGTGKAGEVTFRWSDSRTGGFETGVKVKQWNATGVKVPALGPDHRTPPVPLKDGVAVWFCSHRDPQFNRAYTYHFNTYAAMNDVIWGEVYVPPETAPGVYTGKLTITAADEAPVEFPLALTVWNFTLPKKKSVATAYHGWMSDSYYTEVTNVDWQLELLLHEHHLDFQTVHGQNLGARWKFEDTDWTEFDREVGRRLDGSAYPDGVPMNMFHLAMYQPGMGNKQPEEITRAAKALATHLKAKGWFDRVYVYCKDEPGAGDFPKIGQDIQAYLAGDPDWRGKFMVTSSPKSYTLKGGDLIDIWCFKYHWWIEPPVWKYLDDNHKTRWIYVANSPPSPNLTYHIDSLKGYEPRLIKWASWKLGASGFLYWMVTLDWVEPNPWVTALNPFGACGDGSFVYHGARNGPKCPDNATPLRPINGPIGGFRLKQIREGLEDWEYLILAEQKAGREAVGKIVATVYNNSYLPYGKNIPEADLERSWTQSEAKLYAARQALAEAILAAPQTPKER